MASRVVSRAAAKGRHQLSAASRRGLATVSLFAAMAMGLSVVGLVAPTAASAGTSGRPAVDVLVANAVHQQVDLLPAGGGAPQVALNFATNVVATDAHGNIAYVTADGSELDYIPVNGTTIKLATFGPTVEIFQLAFDASGNVYAEETPASGGPGGSIVEFPVDGSPPQTVVTGIAGGYGLAIDADGTFYVSLDLNEGEVVTFQRDGTETVVATGLCHPDDVAVDAAHNVYVTDASCSAAYKVTPAGVKTQIGPQFAEPRAIAVDAYGNVYVGVQDYSGTGNGAVVEIPVNGSTPVPLVQGYGGIFQISVRPPGPGEAPAFTSDTSTTVSPRSPFDFQVTTTGLPTAVISEASALPAGVTFVDNGDGTADLSGTPAVGTAGTYPLTITADNGVGTPATQSFTLTVSAAAVPPVITSSSVATATAGNPFGFTVQTTGNPAPTVTRSGALPNGVLFTSNADGTATLAGTPGKAAGGTYPITFKAKNAAGTTTQYFTLTVRSVPVVKKIPTTTTAVGATVSIPVTVTGYPNPRLMAYSLPTGLTLTDNGNGTGTVNGSPAPGSGGLYTVSVQARNVAGIGSGSFTLKINEAPAFTSSNSVSATVGTAFSFQVTAIGYPTPKITRTGALPKGITYSAATQTFSGTPTKAGTYPVTLTATNSSGTVTSTLTITVS